MKQVAEEWWQQPDTLNVKVLSYLLCAMKSLCTCFHKFYNDDFTCNNKNLL